MKKTREFDNILDECLERILSGGETVGQCLASYPEHASELEPLLETAHITRQATSISPRAEFREKARHEFRQAIQEVKPQRGGWFFGWRPQLVPVVLSALVLLLASGGTVAAASGSMPDEPLYTVKLAAEKVQLAVTLSPRGKAELYLKLADRRVAEIVRMADEGRLEYLEATTHRLDNNYIAMANLARPGEPAGVMTAPAPAAAPEIRAFSVPETPVEEGAAATEPPVLMEEAPRAGAGPGPGSSAKGNAPGRQDEVTAPVLEAAGEPEPTSEPEPPGILQRVNSQREALLQALANAPDEAKPALLRALEIAERGYEEALENTNRDDDKSPDKGGRGPKN